MGMNRVRKVEADPLQSLSFTLVYCHCEGYVDWELYAGERKAEWCRVVDDKFDARYDARLFEEWCVGDNDTFNGELSKSFDLYTRSTLQSAFLVEISHDHYDCANLEDKLVWRGV